MCEQIIKLVCVEHKLCVWLGATAGGQKNQVLACHALVTKIEQERGLSPYPTTSHRLLPAEILKLSDVGGSTSPTGPQT